MARMTLLEAVNLILRKLGEIEVSSVDENYPTLPYALAALTEARKTMLGEGYWFNTFYEHTLQPDVDGYVNVPADCSKFFPADGKFAFTGTAIALQGTGSLQVGEPVLGRMIVDKDFETLPEMARFAVAYTAAASTYLGDIGPDATHAELESLRDYYLNQINGDHTTSRKLNSRNRKQQLRWRMALTT